MSVASPPITGGGSGFSERKRQFSGAIIFRLVGKTLEFLMVKYFTKGHFREPCLKFAGGGEEDMLHGTILIQETPDATLRREMGQETGLEPTVYELVYEQGNAGHTKYFYLVFKTRECPELRDYDDKENIGLEWHELWEVIRLTPPAHRTALEAALRRLVRLKVYRKAVRMTYDRNVDNEVGEFLHPILFS